MIAEEKIAALHEALAAAVQSKMEEEHRDAICAGIEAVALIDGILADREARGLD
jgi:hypothetical protein